MEEELKPCPICGGSYLRICDHGGMVHHEYRIECNNGGFSCQTGARTKEDAIAAWNALPRRLRWTKEKPTKEGFWFCRHGETMWVFLLTWNDGRLQTTNLFPTGQESFVDSFDGYEWAGPIPEPEDV